MLDKSELVNEVVKRTGMTKKAANDAVIATVDSIKNELADGGKVRIIGFGNFEVRHRKARKGRNPQTGEEIDIPATNYPAFKPGKILKDLVK